MCWNEKNSQKHMALIANATFYARDVVSPLFPESYFVFPDILLSANVRAIAEAQLIELQRCSVVPVHRGIAVLCVTVPFNDEEVQFAPNNTRMFANLKTSKAPALKGTWNYHVHGQSSVQV